MMSSAALILSALWIVATSHVIEWMEPEQFDSRSMLNTKSLAMLRRAQHIASIGHTTRVPSGGGMTYDFCRRSADCKGNRKCVEAQTQGNSICDGHADCWCDTEDVNNCSWNADCEPGEVCPDNVFITICESESFADDSDESPNRDGFTMDECLTKDDCQPPRSCMLAVNGAVRNCAGGSGCRCLPRVPQQCTTHRECPFGELCAANRENGQSLCFSEAYISNSPELVLLPRQLTFDPCTTGKDCERPRTCMIYNIENELRYCMARSGCFCRPKTLSTCRQSQDCVHGEVCVHSTDRRESHMFCASQMYASQSEDLTVVDGGTDLSPTRPTHVTTSTPSSEQSAENEVCIDAKALQSFDQHDLLYETHRMASTLCDQFHSCATPGHIVLFKGKAMMMRSYCKRTLCNEQVMMVNSPKYRKGLLVLSNTPGLQFSPFAARYETSVEEVFLSSLVRLGI